MLKIYSLALGILLITACSTGPTEDTDYDATKGLTTYIPVKLTTDLSQLTASEKAMLPHLFAAADVMNELFWIQAYGDKEHLLQSISNPDLRNFAEIN